MADRNLVESNAHAPVGGHGAQWSLYDNGSWEASYGPHSEQNVAPDVETARAHAELWIRAMHKAHTRRALEP